MENKFTQQQSVELIKEMIQQAKGNAIETMQTGVMILWGYSIFIASILQFTLVKLELYNYINYAWIGTVAISSIVTFILIKKEKRTKRVKTYVDTIADNVWFGFYMGIILILLLVPDANLFFPAITFIYCFALFVTSIAYKAKELMVSVLIVVGCIISYKFIPVSYYPISMAIAMLCGNIIPGHMLNSYHRKNVKRA